MKRLFDKYVNEDIKVTLGYIKSEEGFVPISSY